jgi:hypothetical protein
LPQSKSSISLAISIPSLLKVIESCRDLKRLGFGYNSYGMILERSYILVAASLPRLESLVICGCRMADDAVSAFSRCRELKEVHIPFLVNPSVLSVVGRNIVHLNLYKPSKEIVDGIIEECPDLQYLTLDLGVEDLEDEVKEEIVRSLKGGLKKLAKLEVDEKSVRLGTDWEGYPEENKGGEA